MTIKTRFKNFLLFNVGKEYIMKYIYSFIQNDSSVAWQLLPPIG